MAATGYRTNCSTSSHGCSSNPIFSPGCALPGLTGVEPGLATPRDSKKEGGKASWGQRLQQMFDDGTDHQWQKNASFMVELRRWIAIFQDEGVQDCYLQLWRRDVGLLMRP